jgi:hypothetical protein
MARGQMLALLLVLALQALFLVREERTRSYTN